MPSDYQAIFDDNRRKYGTDIGRIGPMLLADRYDDRTHFIFELLQNAEDALARRSGRQGSRSVQFDLSEKSLVVSHFGHRFDEADVRGICGIAESTKDLTAIGRFGIGFKSVYQFTDRPQVHSGTEDFAIESFVWPVAVPLLDRLPDQTVILVPLKTTEASAHAEIAAGLGRLGASTLLFLREIEEIRWSVDGGYTGLYLRDCKAIDEGVRRVTLIGQKVGEIEVDETWLLFSRAVTAEEDLHAGHVELAFSLVKDDKSHRERIQRAERSALVVFFPTVLETHLGFLVQGPYRTTPSRDNVPRSDAWNQRLVRETASLLVESLHWLRDHDLLDTTALQCLPLDPTKFGESSMFAPLYGATKQALLSEPLLPRFDHGHVPAPRARLARTQELRELFGPAQLSVLFGHKDEVSWLSGDISQDRTPALRRYLMQELGITEVTPETIIPRLDKRFLQEQSDAWILGLYHFLNDQPALRWRLNELPLIRLEDGTHICANLKGQPQAFLPGAIKTGFPTMRSSVCSTEAAREFLRSLGLTEPDPVDDVVRNVLPKYRETKVSITDADYEADIGRILKAFATDSKVQREKLIAALRDTTFVRVIDAGDSSKWRSKPGNVYLATDRMKELFAGITQVFLVDDSYKSLRGEDVRELLEACGATRYLQPVTVASAFTSEQLRQMRLGAGGESLSWAEPIEDRTLRGLDQLLAALPKLDSDGRTRKPILLWDALDELEDRRGTGVFWSTYVWHYYRSRHATTFDIAFIRDLNATAWVPDRNGDLQRPEFVLFDTLGWKPSPFLQSKIHFKPPIVETLAREAGIEPGVLDLLKKLGLTSEADLRARLRVNEGATSDAEAVPTLTQGNDPKQKLDEDEGTTPGATENTSATGGKNLSLDEGGTPAGDEDQEPSRDDPGFTDPSPNPSTGGGRPVRERPQPPEGNETRLFISYITTHPSDSDGSDPDGLDQQARMALEEKAIKLILNRDPRLQRTPTNNRGFDLIETDHSGQTIRWVEVKAMTGDLHDRPVCLSRAQFDCAWIQGEAYWLYIVEHAGDSDRAGFLCIQDPAGKAKNFAFDQGWRQIADFSRGNPDNRVPSKTKTH
jgi:hypothetical protein